MGILQSLTEGLNITKYPDWVIFVERLDSAIRSGRIREVPVLGPIHGAGVDYKWFLDPETSEIYGYSSPNPPAYPRWERIDVLNSAGPVNVAPLSGIKIGPKTVMRAHFIKQQIEVLVSRGLVEVLPTPASALTSKDRTEKWYRDKVTNVVYRLSEYYPVKGADDIRWEAVPQGELGGKIQ
jgi:hypothetical protein